MADNPTTASPLPDAAPPALHEMVHPDDAPEPPPRGVKTMAVVRWAILALAILLALGSWYSYAFAAKDGGSSIQYQCPMHPEIISDRPGECPICHMNLEPITADRAAQPATPPASSAASPAKPGQYTCPMHPEVVRDEPGSCPKCNMHLVRVEATPDEHSTPEGTTHVALSLDRVQAIGVRTAKVEEGSTAVAVRAPAIVEAPEQSVAQVHVRAAGFVEGISVGQTGVRVKPGQLLASIYSPEIYQAQSELLATQNWPVLGQGNEARDIGARRKLELLGVPSAMADKVIAEKKPFRTTGISAPIGGYITKKNVVLGSFVTPEMVLYEIVDLSKVYVVADLFQGDVGAVSVGTKGSFKSNNRPAPVEATVDLVYPQVNVQARTTRVRMTLGNAELTLFPGEYGLVEFGVKAGKSVIVPADAVVDTGREQYVFVEVSPGTYAPRSVKVAGEVDGGFEVRSGLAAGETVVSGATFLIDSESRLRASIGKSTSTRAKPTEGSGAPAPAATEHRH